MDETPAMIIHSFTLQQFNDPAAYALNIATLDIEGQSDTLLSADENVTGEVAGAGEGDREPPHEQ